MSEKQLSPATRKRLPRIIKGLLKGETYDKIAEACGLKSRRTIERDVHAWRDSGGLEKWLETEFLKLHGKVIKKDVVEAYKQIAKLLGKTLVKKIEAQLEQKAPFVVEIWKPKKDEANDKAAT